MEKKEFGIFTSFAYAVGGACDWVAEKAGSLSDHTEVKVRDTFCVPHPKEASPEAILEARKAYYRTLAAQKGLTEFLRHLKAQERILDFMRVAGMPMTLEELNSLTDEALQEKVKEVMV